MKRYSLLVCALLLVFSAVRCGYTTSSSLGGYRTIFIEPFKNKIVFTRQNVRDIYFPLMEVKIRDAVVNRIMFDGHLRMNHEDSSDLIMKGELVGYDRVALRYTDNNDPLEYRVQIMVNLQLIDQKANQPVWDEPGFVGEATYFVSGPLTKTEQAAVEEATRDLAKRVIERLVENW